MIHTVKGFSTVSETEVDVFLVFPCFFYDSANVGNVFSCSSAFCKPSLNIWKVSVHIILKPSLEDFEHNLTSMKDECNCPVVWRTTVLLGNWDEDCSSPVLWPLLGFQICWDIECSTLIASFLRISNSSAGIPSAPLALLAVVLPEAHLTSHSRMSGSEWETTPSWLSGSLRSYLYCFSVYFFYLF